jgi:hypothetical protein
MLGYSYVSRAAGQGLAPARETLAQLDELMSASDRGKALAMSSSQAVPSSRHPKTARTANALPVAPKTTAPKAVVAKPVARKVVTTSTIKPAGGPPTGDWRIQLGAFSQRGGAEAYYHRVSGKSALAGRSPSYVAAGKVVRLQVGPYASRAAAEAACRAVGAACFPVPAK